MSPFFNAVPPALDGLLTREQMMALPQFGGWKSKRSWIRAEARGLPVIRCGRLRLYDPVAVREWLTKPKQHVHRRRPYVANAARSLRSENTDRTRALRLPEQP